MPEKILLSWSGGKDCAYALHQLRRKGDYEVAGVLTTVTEGYDRISMHGVRRALLEAQAEALGLPLVVVTIPKVCDNGTYEQAMRDMLLAQREAGVTAVAFGDLFLEDLKLWREEKMAQVEMGAVFPIWQMDTAALARAFIEEGFRTILSCVDTEVLDASFAGREYDASLLDDLPPTVDPCGENGEFHSFTWDGPIFSAPIRVTRGEVVLRDERWAYCDLLPA